MNVKARLWAAIAILLVGPVEAAEPEHFALSFPLSHHCPDAKIFVLKHEPYFAIPLGQRNLLRDNSWLADQLSGGAPLPTTFEFVRKQHNVLAQLARLSVRNKLSFEKCPDLLERLNATKGPYPTLNNWQYGVAMPPQIATQKPNLRD